VKKGDHQHTCLAVRVSGSTPSWQSASQCPSARAPSTHGASSTRTFETACLGGTPRTLRPVANATYLFSRSSVFSCAVFSIGAWGQYVGVPAGMVFDRFGPRVQCVYGGVLGFTGYFLMYLQLKTHFSTSPVLMGFFYAMVPPPPTPPPFRRNERVHPASL
jgi:hypothetical protein